MIDWERLEPFLEVRHEPTGARKYRPPVNRHGTHVAGIIAADWRATDEDAGLQGPPTSGTADMTGVSPEVELYDLRVLDDNGEGNEFAIMSALQFVRDLNNRKDFVAIHGVNLSFSIDHDVANYACGRTPVCEEAERLVGSGITVVAAAGNSGRARYLTPTGAPDDGFRTVSITDPGNADSAITVGATHRRDPHTYGVSYFSSRGPTGDGRLKPDLVAPGEKIRSTTPDNGVDRLDGTSMAAPHVSGAVALIMSRHPELIGQPARLKRILCDTATDLGRERYFQGAGLLDTLRALESI
jgi:subtilisin family serine protease